jgi:hypothetical protein
LDPVHTGHLELMEASRRHLERTGKVVLAGYIAPVLEKEEQVDQEAGAALALCFADRVALCAAATSDSDWLVACGWGLGSWDTCNKLESVLNDPSLTATLTKTGRRLKFVVYHVSGMVSEAGARGTNPPPAVLAVAQRALASMPDADDSSSRRELSPAGAANGDRLKSSSMMGAVARACTRVRALVVARVGTKVSAEVLAELSKTGVDVVVHRHTGRCSDASSAKVLQMIVGATGGGSGGSRYDSHSRGAPTRSCGKWAGPRRPPAESSSRGGGGSSSSGRNLKSKRRSGNSRKQAGMWGNEGSCWTASAPKAADNVWIGDVDSDGAADTINSADGGAAGNEPWWDELERSGWVHPAVLKLLQARGIAKRLREGRWQ